MIVDVLGLLSRRNYQMPKPSDLLQGTLDLLILKTLAREPLHGWGIAKRIQQLSDEVLSVQQGSLYPALHRLEQQGWIAAEWKDSDLGRSAKFYELTRDGRRQLEREQETWTRLSSAVRLLLKRA
jgi:transcriptional regulator